MDSAPAKKMGRPRNEVDIEQLKKLASIQCTNVEIAAWFGVSVDTITRNFADIIKECKETGKASLKRLLWRSAEKGNFLAMKFLATNYTDLREKPEINVNLLPTPVTIETIDGRIIEMGFKEPEEIRRIQNEISNSNGTDQFTSSSNGPKTPGRSGS